MREREQTTGVIFIRHGTTDFPKKRLYCDRVEHPPLNTRGQAQAENAARLLREEPLAAIFSSPILRAQTTAEIIAEANGAPLQLDERLQERDMGDWDGLWFDEIQRDHAELFTQWKADPAAFVPPGGESLYDLRDRLQLALEEWLETYRGQTIAVVCHVGPLRVAVCEALGLPLTQHRLLTIENAAPTRINYGRHQNNLIYFNRI